MNDRDFAPLLDLLEAFRAPPEPLYRFDPVPGFSPYAYGDDVYRFFRRASELDVVAHGDWTSWRSEADRHFEFGVLATADLDTLGRVMAVWSRAEEDAPGSWARLIDASLLTAWLERLAAIQAAAEPAPHPADTAAAALLASHEADFPSHARWSMKLTPGLPIRWPPAPGDERVYFAFGISHDPGDGSRRIADGVFISNIGARITVSEDGERATWEQLAGDLRRDSIQGVRPIDRSEARRGGDVLFFEAFSSLVPRLCELHPPARLVLQSRAR